MKSNLQLLHLEGIPMKVESHHFLVNSVFIQNRNTAEHLDGIQFPSKHNQDYFILWDSTLERNYTLFGSPCGIIEYYHKRHYRFNRNYKYQSYVTFAVVYLTWDTYSRRLYLKQIAQVEVYPLGLILKGKRTVNSTHHVHAQ